MGEGVYVWNLEPFPDAFTSRDFDLEVTEVPFRQRLKVSIELIVVDISNSIGIYHIVCLFVFLRIIEFL